MAEGFQESETHSKLRELICSTWKINLKKLKVSDVLKSWFEVCFLNVSQLKLLIEKFEKVIELWWKLEHL